MQSFNAIIFDLGGVILNINYRLTASAFKKLGIPDFDSIYTQLRQTPLFDDFETGNISPAEFRKRIKALLPPGVTDAQVDEAWNAMLLSVPIERLQLLEKLSKKYRLFLLSNTNIIHIKAYLAYLKKHHSLPNLSHIFEKEYYSYEIGMRKPNQEIFDFVIAQNKLNPKETIFIDDSPQHIQGAAAAGVRTFHLPAPATILQMDILKV